MRPWIETLLLGSRVLHAADELVLCLGVLPALRSKAPLQTPSWSGRTSRAQRIVGSERVPEQQPPAPLRVVSGHHVQVVGSHVRGRLLDEEVASVGAGSPLCGGRLAPRGPEGDLAYVSGAMPRMGFPSRPGTEMLECPGMSEPTPKEYANLYMRGVNEAAAGVELEAQEVLDVLDVFGKDGMRRYLIGHLEGIKDREEAELEEYEMLEASLAFEVHESSVSVLEETEDMLQVWVEFAPKDLSTVVNLHIVNNKEQILLGGRIVRVEFEDAVDDDAERGQEVTRDDTEVAPGIAPAAITVEKWKYVVTEYEPRTGQGDSNGRGCPSTRLLDE